CHRPGEHPRCLRRTHPPQARGTPRRSGDIDAPRGRVPAAMRPVRRSGLALRGRLLLFVLGALAAVLAGLTLSFNLVLGDRLDNDANGVAQARASAELASLQVSRGRIRLPEAPDELSPDIQIWVFEGVHGLERPHTAVANDIAATAAASRAP